MTNEAIREKVIGVTQYRDVRINSESIDEEARSVDVAFSSDAPVERWWGFESLGHDSGEVRMERLLDGAPLLLDHRSGQQIGVIESAKIDGKDNKGRATVRFSRGPLGEEVFQDVRDEIRSKISVGYVVHAMRLERQDEDVDYYRVTDWEPLEISFVSIPADNSVGVGRSLPMKSEAIMPEEKKAPVGQPTEENRETQAAQPAPQEPTQENREHQGPQAPANPEAEQIRTVAAHFQMRDLGEDHIMLGGTLEQFRDKVRQQRPDPVPVVPKIQARIPHAGNLRAFTPNLYDGGRKEAEEAAYRAGMFCRAAIFADDDAARWCRDHQVLLALGKDGKQLSRVLTGIASGQQVLIPTELALPIINLREQYGVMRRLAYVHPMASDTTTVPRRTSGITAYFVGLEAAPTANDPGLDNISLAARNLAAETRIANDYADDSVINLADFVADEHALAFATKEDDSIINGDGTSTYGGIVGLRTLLAAAGGLAGSIDAASNHDTFGEITVTDLSEVAGALPDFPGLMPVWLASKRGEATMFGRLRAAGSGNAKRDLAASVPKVWDGDEIEISQVMPKGTSATDYSDVVMALYGDFRRGVVLGDRRGMTMLTDPYSLSSYQQTKIISSERFDANCHGVGDTSNAGPIVALVGE